MQTFGEDMHMVRHYAVRVDRKRVGYRRGEEILDQTIREPMFREYLPTAITTNCDEIDLFAQIFLTRKANIFSLEASTFLVVVGLNGTHKSKMPG